MSAGLEAESALSTARVFINTTVDITENDFKNITNSTNIKMPRSTTIVFGVMAPVAFIGVILYMCKKGKFNSCETSCTVLVEKDIDIDDYATLTGKMLSETNYCNCESGEKGTCKPSDGTDIEFDKFKCSYANKQNKNYDRNKYTKDQTSRANVSLTVAVIGTNKDTSLD